MQSWVQRSLFGLTLLLMSFSPGWIRTQNNLTFTVDRLTDASPDGGGEGSGSAGDLRFAITHARSGDTIILGVAGEIQLSSALPILTQEIYIVGPSENLLIVRGSGSGSILAVDNDMSVVLSNLTLTGGAGNGGGIFNRGTLILNNVTVSGNRAGDPTNGGGTGAGIWNYSNATLVLNNSTVSGNSALGNASYNPSRGGGIANYGTLTLNNSTVSGNSISEGSGGGISNTLPTSILTLNNSTVSGNSATGMIGTGSGIDNSGTLSLSSTIIAGNTKDDLRGPVTSQGHNLIGNSNGGSGFRSDLGDLLDVDPRLGPLQDNGGLTRTHALLAGSPAIDQGNEATCPPGDQRNYSRPSDGDGNGTQVCDIGSYEVNGNPSTTTVTPEPVGTSTPTITLTTVSTDTLTPTMEGTTGTASPVPTSTLAPPSPPCAGAAILAALFSLLMRLRLR